MIVFKNTQQNRHCHVSSLCTPFFNRIFYLKIKIKLLPLLGYYSSERRIIKKKRKKKIHIFCFQYISSFILYNAIRNTLASIYFLQIPRYKYFSPLRMIEIIWENGEFRWRYMLLLQANGQFMSSSKYLFLLA